MDKPTSSPLSLYEKWLVALGIAVIIITSLPWFTVTPKDTVFGATITGQSVNVNGWGTGLGAWLFVAFMVYLLARAVLPTFTSINPLKHFHRYVWGALAFVLLLLIGWGTYTQPSSTVHATYGQYLAIIEAVAACVVCWRAGRATKRAEALPVEAVS